eukprot:gb/GECH01012015.1/.p1 GENE.gb/GECH01012015.1/~~gb/GECH01012015.1/.p1  ORF type:complete len:471 (+),score=137.34 gb/GECH01012015.1/:1-1413(+)
MTNIKINWVNQKDQFEFEVKDDETGKDFKERLSKKTGVYPERMKLMGFKGGLLKDDVNMGNLKVKPGQKVKLMGSQEKPPEKPKEDIVFLEDLPPEEQYGAMSSLPSGLVNLGNTCYMNATLQCLRNVPELKKGLEEHQSNTGDGSSMVVKGLQNVYRELENTKSSVTPQAFINAFRTAFPQFNEQQGGIHLQQDADEAWNQLMTTLDQTLSTQEKGSLTRALFGGNYHATLKCEENESEEPSTKLVPFSKLPVNIKSDTSELTFGLKNSLENQLEKHSPSLERSALYKETRRIHKLPPYLAVQLVRFYAKPNKDGEMKGVKILKKVKFPMVLDAYDLCTDELKKKLEPKRKEISEEQEAELQRQRKAKSKGETPEKMEVEDVGEVWENPTGWYELCGVLTHKGRSAQSGHYVGWAKQDDGTWMKFDDDKVSEVKEDDIRNLSGGGDWHMAYILLYRAKKPDGSLQGPPS